ncbi:MAG: DUF3990 domain-containing protein [Prevotella sp.]|nr:DUF3990 domain-containing protein [Bacteroidales bacterium]MBQ6653485.1 DUF3990 domain-containing protein [Prevotella sp.]
MNLYHGTNADILQIDLWKSRVGKDFGLGFYLTPDKQVAQRQAERKFEQYGVGSARVYEYSVEDNAIQALRVLQFNSYSLEWARFVLMNRKNRTRIQIHDYDIVIGPIADDVIGYQIRRVEEGIITEEQFLEEIKYHTVTIQYIFATEKALQILRKL